MANSHVQGLSLRTQVHVMTLGRTIAGINKQSQTCVHCLLRASEEAWCDSHGGFDIEIPPVHTPCSGRDSSAVAK